MSSSFSVSAWSDGWLLEDIGEFLVGVVSVSLTSRTRLLHQANTQGITRDLVVE